MADLLVFSTLVSSSPSPLASAGAIADHFVTESTATSGQREGPAFFSWFLVTSGAAVDRFVAVSAVTTGQWGVSAMEDCAGLLGKTMNSAASDWYVACLVFSISSLFQLILPQMFFRRYLRWTVGLYGGLLDNEKNQTSSAIMVLWDLFTTLGKISSHLPWAPHQKRRENGAFTWELSLSFSEIFLNLLMLLWQTWIWDLNGLGFFLGSGLMDGWKPFFFYILVAVNHWVDGLWAFSEFLDFRIWSAVDWKNGPLQ